MKRASRFSYLFVALTLCALLGSATVANAGSRHLKRQRIAKGASIPSLASSKLAERFAGDASPVGPSGLSLAIAAPLAPDLQRVWANTGTDFNTGANWGGTAPGAGDVGAFTSAAVAQPNLSSSLSIAGLYFSGTGSSGYDVTSSGGAVFTFTGQTNGTTETSNSNSAAIRADNTSGTNTVDAAMILAPASGSTSTFNQAGGGLLVVNGGISGTGITLNLSNSGTVQLNGTNSYTGGTTINGGTLQIGNDSALGTGTLTMSATTGVLQATGGARTIANNVVWASSGTISGGNNITINGTFTSSGAVGRTITVNSINTTLGGNVFLAASDVAGGLTFAGSGTLTINGIITNNAGANTVASGVTLNSSTGGTLALNGANTYTGATALSQGNLSLGNKSAFGTGTVAWNGVSTSASTDLSGLNAIGNTNTWGATGNVFTGTNNIQLNGSVTNTSASANTVTNTMSGGATLTLVGGLNLSSTAANRTVTFAGTGNTTITGVIANGGTSTASALALSGGTLTLTNSSNTYGGGTTISGGSLVVDAAGALGTGSVSLTASSVSLTLQSGGTNNYINDSASISIVSGAVTALNFTGTPDTVSGITLGGVAQTTAGTYGGIGTGADFESAFFSGSGELLLAIPEPSTWMMIGVGAVLLAGVQRFRRK